MMIESLARMVSNLRDLARAIETAQKVAAEPLDAYNTAIFLKG
jgi:hypothetical protein